MGIPNPAEPPEDIQFRRSLAARYQSLIRLAEAIRGRDHEELFGILADELQRVVQFDGIAQYDDAATKVNWRFCEPCASPAPNPIAGLDNEQTVAWWVHHNQEPVVIPLIETETRFPATIDRLRNIGYRSLCALPLSTTHRRLGSLVLVSRQADAYSDDEVRFLSMVAAQIALAIDDTLNFRESQRNGERLRLLLDLTNRVVSILDLREVLREIAASIRRVMQCDAVGVTLPDPDTGQLRLCALDFPTSKGIIREGIVVSSASVSVLQVLQTGQPVNLTPEQISAEHMVASEGARSLCRLPLTSHGRVLGVLTLGTSRENAFGADDMEFLAQVANQVAMAVENALAYGQIEELKDKLAQEKVYLEDEIRSELNFEEIIGTSEGLRRVLREVETVAPTDSTVLIYGETGTGKELIARAVHNLSSRKANAFVKLNCAAIPTGLLESELFGHERGAFTGAMAQRVGRFELAHRGTVFLDEIGEIPLDTAAEAPARAAGARVRAIGQFAHAAQRRPPDCRHQSRPGSHGGRTAVSRRPVLPPECLPDPRPRAARAGGGHSAAGPPFRGTVRRRNQRNIDTIPSGTMEALVRYHWPGNIRELQNVIERAVIVSRGPVLNVPVADLKIRPEARPKPEKREPVAGENLRGILGETERQQILSALEQSNWLVAGPNGAAARLGMKRSTLQFRMRRLGIRISRTGASA